MIDKKRMMFILSEDYYFLTYTTLLTLHYFGCTTSSNYFVDHRKIGYLVDFIGDESLMAKLQNSVHNENTAGSVFQEYFAAAYDRASARLPVFNRVVFVLRKRGFLGDAPAHTLNAQNIFLNEEALPTSFLNGQTFESERRNLGSVRSLFRQFRRMKLDTLLDRVYGDQGILTW